ncbi:unnamed protein product [Adineta ricciae]|uniref:NADP-dependent oxidoreductase domain-containing protein n=1 Tax=Adineta ricciae TaxID=249248 RepID=A0A815F749_ADIRI|nr:unnamed protein product [Adineta ricciae]CAF1328248.1 unnamed protein product [Adineta ricciae]
MQSLNHLVKAGKVFYLGVSDSSPWVVTKASQYARDHGLRQFSDYQGLYNAAERDAEREILPMLLDESYRKITTIKRNKKRRERDSEIFRNIMISFSVYFLGGVPYLIYTFTDNEFLYSLGVVSVTFAVNIEKLVIVYLDREIRNIVRNYFCQRQTRVIPVTLNAMFTVRQLGS